MYYTYLIRLADNSLYTGITTDLSRRMAEHAARGKKSARYTRARAFVRLEAAWKSDDRPSASRLEWAIKRLKKEQKERLCLSPSSLQNVIPALDADAYRAVDPAAIN